jgi:hypothetical protein
MTEDQVRDILARVVPEPPDSVTDATPVVRAARRQRQARVIGVAGLAAVLVAGTFLGVRVLLADDDKDLVADTPDSATADPYTTAQCPPASERWISAPVADLDRVTAVRYCARGTDAGFFVADGPPDALVTGLASFASSVRDLAPADPARCAAVSVMPSDSRLLLVLADGTSVGVAAGFCQDVDAEGRTLDGNDLTKAFLDRLRAQRDEHAYSAPAAEAPVGCVLDGTIGPAVPGHEQLVSAVLCSAEGTELTTLGEGLLSDLDAAWSAARPQQEWNDPCEEPAQAPPYVLARTDRGDVVRLDVGRCGEVYFYGDDPAAWYRLELTKDDLTGG